MNKISIIVCSRQKKPPPDFIKNIEVTIGCEFQFIFIDNSESSYSIFEAYNQGIQKSSNKILCFLHDDIQFHTNNWGKVLLDLFQIDKELGLVGIAGSKIKTKTPSAWWNCPQPYRAANIIQHFNKENTEYWDYGFKKSEEEVVVIDGVFMAARKDNHIRFNENLKGFHNYDLSYSIDYVKQGYKVMVTNNILLEHFSMGLVDSSWYKSSMDFHVLYKNFLPLNTKEVPEDALQRQEFSNGIVFTKGLIKNGYFKEAFRSWVKLFLKKPISKKHISIVKPFFD